MSRNNVKKKGTSKIRRLDMAKFAPSKANWVGNVWALLPSTKSMGTSSTITTSIAGPRVADTTIIMASICRMCKRWGLHCSFCAQSAPHPSPVESDWSNEDWNGENKELKRGEEETRTTSPTEGRRPD